MKMDFAFNAMSSMCKKKKELPLCKIVIICFQMIEDDWPSAEEDQDKGDVVYGSCVSGFILGLTSLAMMKLRWRILRKDISILIDSETTLVSVGGFASGAIISLWNHSLQWPISSRHRHLSPHLYPHAKHASSTRLYSIGAGQSICHLGDADVVDPRIYVIGSCIEKYRIALVVTISVMLYIILCFILGQDRSVAAEHRAGINQL